MPPSLTLTPVPAPVQAEAFLLAPTLIAALQTAGVTPQPGDVIAVSSKYAAISEGRVVRLADVTPGDEAQTLADRYHIQPELAQLVLDEADFVFGGIRLGYLLTATHGIISPNAGLDRSNIPAGQVVLFSQHPYQTAYQLRTALTAHYRLPLGVVLTDSCLMPGRLGTVGVALAAAGFKPTQDERGQPDLFGNPMAVTVRSLADTIATAAQLVMGERDEATPCAVVRGLDLTPTDEPLTVDDVAIDWRYDIYIESLTAGLRGEDVIRAIADAPPYTPPSADT
jgi:coenzyme F420-0:L-glutamate ligase / coenzyme F420-1:gamma-L-glutamate ligase